MEKNKNRQIWSENFEKKRIFPLRRKGVKKINSVIKHKLNGD